MRSDEPNGRTTHHTDEHRDPKRRDRQSDQILEGWTWGRVTKIGTAFTILGGIVVGIVSVGTALLVTRPEFEKVSDSVAAMGSRSDRRFQRIESRQDDAEDLQRLLIPMARAQCIQLDRWRSESIAEAAGLPCDSLLRRVRR